MTWNGIDLFAIMEETGHSKVKSIKRLQELTGATLDDCKAALDKPYQDYYDSDVKTRVSAHLPERKTVQVNQSATQEDPLRPKVIYDATTDTTPRCPKCGSTSLSANKKGFGFGKAVVGGIALGVVGLAAGGLGKNKVIITCLNCGHTFKPGQK